MIEMQYNFPLLPAQGEQWQSRLAAAVAALSPANADELRPTFRMPRTAQRELAAAWLHSDPACTHITCGTHHGTLISLLAAGLAGRPIAVEEVTYTAIIEQARMLASPLIACAFDAQGILPASLRAACEHAAAAGRPIAALYTMPTVHNPLGCVASLQRREEITAVARAHDLLLLEDAAYAYMAPDAPPSYAVLAPERTFYVRGTSKSYAPAAFTGFLVAPPRFTPAIQTAIKNTATGTSLPHNTAALSLIADGTLDRIIAEKLTEGALRNYLARQLLGEHAAPGADCAWHLWVTLPASTTPQAFEALMATRGVLLSGGNWFAADPAANHPSTRGLRIGLGGEVDRARTQLGVQLLAAALAEINAPAPQPSAVAP